MDGDVYSNRHLEQWCEAQAWIDDLEREARVAYWNTRIEFERRVKRFLDAVAGEDDDER